MSRFDALSLLPDSIRSWALENIHFTTESGETYVELMDYGYRINLGDNFDVFSPGQKKIALLHELAHVLRGDCLLQADDSDLLNISADATINGTMPELDKHFPIKVNSRGNYYREVAYYWDYAQYLPQVPDNRIVSTMELYYLLQMESSQNKNKNEGPAFELIMSSKPGGGSSGDKKSNQQQDQVGNGKDEENDNVDKGDGGSGNNSQDDETKTRQNQNNSKGSQNQTNDECQREGLDAPPRNSASSYEKAEEVHARTILSARKIDELNKMAGLDIIISRRRVFVKPQPLPAWARLLGKIRSRIRRNGYGTLVDVRTYNRPGRAEGLRGIGRYPRLTVLVVLDVSGSCMHLEPLFRGLAQVLKRNYDVRLALFADRFSEIKTPTSIADVGGGTQIRPVLEGIKKINPSLAIVITDGYFFDEPSDLPNCPIWFVLKGMSSDRWRNKLRKKDKIFLEE